MDNCCISCQAIADMENFYDDLIIINLYKCDNIRTLASDCRPRADFGQLLMMIRIEVNFHEERLTFHLAGKSNARTRIFFLAATRGFLRLPTNEPVTAARGRQVAGVNFVHSRGQICLKTYKFVNFHAHPIYLV